MKIFTFREVCQRWLYYKDQLHLKIKAGELVPAVKYRLPDISDYYINHLSNGERITHAPRLEKGIPNTEIDLSYLHDPVSLDLEPSAYRLAYAALQPSPSRARCAIGTNEYRFIENLPEPIPCTGEQAESSFVFPLEVLETAERIMGIKPRQVEKSRDSKLKSYIGDAFDSFKKSHSYFPENEEELIRFVKTNPITGYIANYSDGKYEHRSLTVESRKYTWKAVRHAFLVKKIDTQFDGS